MVLFSCKFNQLLVKLGQAIDWKVFDQEFGKHYAAKVGRPATRIRLIVGLTYLQFMYEMSDEAVVERWVESPYWQHFCGEEYFRHDFPLHLATLVKWRIKIGEQGCQWLLTQILQAGKKLGVLKTSSLNKIVIDTTCMEKAIANHTPKQVFVDRGYRGSYLQEAQVVMTGQRRHSKTTKRWMKRRNSIEPVIGHLKSDHKIKRNWLKGHLGDCMAPILAGRGFNLKKILRALVLFAPEIYWQIMALLKRFYKTIVISSQQSSRINLLLRAAN